MRLGRWVVPVGCALSMRMGCALLTPLPGPTTLEERLASLPTTALPLHGEVRLRWNRHQVPIILAEKDDDAPFALGLVHAHLRLGQMMLAKHIATGRLAELAGPVAIDLDRTIRTLGLTRGIEASLAAMPAGSRRWLERFVEGVNLYQERMETLPYEHRLLGVGREVWTPGDVLAIGRLGGIDISWGRWLSLLPLRDDPAWPEIWRDALEAGPSFPSSPVRLDPESEHAVREARQRGEPLLALLRDVVRIGSNSAAVSGWRTERGGALIASDPHLGFLLPNFWLIAGLQSPGYRVVGLMAPGLPVFALGRNPELAWGGTNLYAASSDLVDVSELDPDSFTVEEETLRVRFWPDRRIRRRITAYGPLLDDAPLFPIPDGRKLALRWIGHEATDEVTALLRTMRASRIEEVRAALASYALPALNWIVAERSGRIAHLFATRLPGRPLERPRDLITTPAESDRAWRRRFDATTLPARIEPEAGFLASANDRPTLASPTPIGFFFGGPDRIQRLRELLADPGRERPGRRDRKADDDRPRERERERERDTERDPSPAFDLERLATVQRDVVSVSAREIMRLLESHGAAPPRLTGFRGAYPATSEQALLFEAFLVELSRELAASPDTPQVTAAKRSSAGPSLGSGGSRKAGLLARLERLDSEAVRGVAFRAARAADLAALDDQRWGDRHRFGLAHPFARIPVLGRRHAIRDRPAPGSFETLQKTAHPFTIDRHTSDFGSQSRHRSDLADPDANHFVLLGGNDGWIGSPNFHDQVALWRRGESIRMPLREAVIEREFPIEQILSAQPP